MVQHLVSTLWQGRILVRLLLLVSAFVGPGNAFASAVTPGQLTLASTTQSIGIEWVLSGDTDHDATCAVNYRVLGESVWQSAMSLVRVDSGNQNTLAGSIMFLAPDTAYEIQVALNDPDGGADTRIVSVATLPVPVAPIPARTLHVVPGNGGGDGSAGDPYRGAVTAWAEAQPGDELLLHAGNYGGLIDDSGNSGGTASPIIFRAAGDGNVVFSYIQVLQRSNLWFEGLIFNYDGSSDTGFYSSLLNPGYDNGFQPMLTDVNNIVLKGNRFEGFKHAIRAGPSTDGWYIADNTIIGDKQLGISGTESFDGEGIELGRGSNHEVAFNSITRVADGVSFPQHNCDIYGNDIFDVTDDGIELDYGQANTRIWQNRIHNAGHNGVAFQPQDGAPWYIVRNQIVNMQESVFKFRNGSRFVAVHNTFVNWDFVLDHWSHQLLRGITRNNLWISVNNGPIWKRGSEGISWQTDLDYDGFDWGTNNAPFEVNGTKYADLTELRAATGQQNNGIQIDASTCFESFDVPGPPPLTTIPPQWMTLQETCAAVDAGVSIPNLGDSFTGAAPDMGAHERGAPNPHYGPRTGSPPPANGFPVANAGPDQTGDEGASVLLSGADSSDPDGDALSFAWLQTSGPQAAITNANQMTAGVTLPEVGATTTLVFQLTVTDPHGASSSDSVLVTVNDSAEPNAAPVADAGPDTSGNEGSQLTLSGAGSSDPDGDALSFAWLQTSGPQAAITNANQMTAGVTLPEVGATTTLAFQLTVTDPHGASSSDSVVVTVHDSASPNAAPVADAGPDTSGNESSQLTLSGAGSSDPDGDTLSFTWLQTSGPQAAITNANQMTAGVTLPEVDATTTLVFRLTVTDPYGASSSDSALITVNDSANPNAAPVADAGPDASGNEGSQLTLSGAGSSDPDGDALSFAWLQTSGPQAAITNADQMTAGVTLPEVGATTTLAFQLTVTDPYGASSSDSVMVTVNDFEDPNTAPVADAGSNASGNEGSQLTLSGAGSSDPDGHALSFAWLQTSGPQAAITNANQMTAGVTLPEVAATTTLVFQLTVTDPFGASASDSVSLTVNNVSTTPAEQNGGGSTGPLWLIFLAAIGLRRKLRI